MSKVLFSNDEIDKLSKNKYVLKVSEKAITYTNSSTSICTNRIISY